jgi:hypothetical protein
MTSWKFYETISKVWDCLKTSWGFNHKMPIYQVGMASWAP